MGSVPKLKAGPRCVAPLFRGEGEEVLPENLMDSARNKFNALSLAKRWMAKTAEETRIVMLEAKLRAMEKGNNRRSGDTPKRKRGNGDEERPRSRRKFIKTNNMPEWFQRRTAPKNPKETKHYNGKT